MRSPGPWGVVGAAAALLVFWHLAAVAAHSPALPPPWPALAAFWQSLGRGMERHVAVSAARVLASLAWAAALAVPAGLVLGRYPALDRWVAPLIYLTYPIPKVAFLFLVIHFLGIYNLAKIFLIGLIVFFQLLVTARDAARSVPRELLLSVRSLGAGETQLFRHVVFPAALPALFTAARIGLGTAIAVLFLTETFATDAGIGYFLVDAYSRFDYAALFAGIMAMSLMGLVLYVLLDGLEGRVCRWRRA